MLQFWMDNFCQKSVSFNANLNKKVKEELVGEGRVSTVKLNIMYVLQDCIIGVQAFTKEEIFA